MNLLNSLFGLLLSFFNPIIIIPITLIIIYIYNYTEYTQTNYYKITKKSFHTVCFNKGYRGEYYTYKHLRHLEKDNVKFLFNVYIPKLNGTTSEIDMLMICPKGILVFESKNYSGWIFGNENQKTWCQTLPRGRYRSHKEHFYNPIMQNHSHIKHLQIFLKEQISMHSIIVFSERCTLKRLQIQSKDVRVIKRHEVATVVSNICNNTVTKQLDDKDILDIYERLYPFTQVNQLVKEQHIANIHNDGINKKSLHNDSTIAIQTLVHQYETSKRANNNKTESITQMKSPNSISIDNTEIESEPLPPVENNQQSLKCPLCNGDLILRTATRGAHIGMQFFGCSNFPKCRYMQNISDNNDKPCDNVIPEHESKL